jgi:membrane protein DedA with SNARE-associated domain
MDLSHMLEQYGYLAVLLGTFVEGETMLLLGSYAAHRGYLDLAGVMLTAFVAAVAADQMFFHLGRRHGARWLAGHPRLRAKVESALARVERRSTWVVLGMRFMWGLRIALPLAAGMSRMNPIRFLILDVVAAAIWSAVFAAVGYGGTQVLTRGVADFHRHEALIVGALLVLAAGVLLWRSRPAKRGAA